VNKDCDAAYEVAEAFGIIIAETPFADALAIAATGLIVEG
jgi:Holliday junction resolvasome RuvABC endonuclease subunit